jgi:hypothetical protein
MPTQMYVRQRRKTPIPLILLIKFAIENRRQKQTLRNSSGALDTLRYQV